MTKEIGMTDKKEAVSLKINQINVGFDSLFNQRLYAEGTTPLNCGFGKIAPCRRLLVTIFNTHVKNGVMKKYMYYVWNPV